MSRFLTLTVLLAAGAATAACTIPRKRVGFTRLPYFNRTLGSIQRPTHNDPGGSRLMADSKGEPLA